MESTPTLGRQLADFGHFVFAAIAGLILPAMPAPTGTGTSTGRADRGAGRHGQWFLRLPRAAPLT